MTITGTSTNGSRFRPSAGGARGLPSDLFAIGTPDGPRPPGTRPATRLSITDRGRGRHRGYTRLTSKDEPRPWVITAADRCPATSASWRPARARSHLVEQLARLPCDGGRCWWPGHVIRPLLGLLAPLSAFAGCAGAGCQRRHGWGWQPSVKTMGRIRPKRCENAPLAVIQCRDDRNRRLIPAPISATLCATLPNGLRHARALVLAGPLFDLAGGQPVDVVGARLRRIASSKNAPERVEHCLTQNAPGATSACQSDYAGSGAFSA